MAGKEIALFRRGCGGVWESMGGAPGTLVVAMKTVPWRLEIEP
jgi:hypothetical protein